VAAERARKPAAADSRAAIRARARIEGFDAVGFAAADPDTGNARDLADFIGRGYHGDMGWLAANAERRASPRGLWPEARSIVVVGTTATRALESAVGDDGPVAAFEGAATLTVRPGHRFRAVDVLLTNFHLPRSSLLLLVAAFAGRELVLRAYRHAVAAKYRFYSYGDAMLLL